MRSVIFYNFMQFVRFIMIVRFIEKYIYRDVARYVGGGVMDKNELIKELVESAEEIEDVRAGGTGGKWDYDALTEAYFLGGGRGGNALR